MTSERWLRNIEAKNQHNLRRLIESLAAPGGVIPFVGAGMSVEFGFKQWAGFLLEQASLANVEIDVKDLLSRGLYEEAAELVMKRLEPGAFQHAMEDEFGDYKLENETVRGAVRFLPKIAAHQVITTNFDRVLEWAFRNAGPGYEFRAVISGARKQAVSKALRHGSRVLIKIHGDVEDSQDRVLTKEEYDRHYGRADPGDIASTELTDLMRTILLTRPLLFLGCSLESDRVVAMLKKLSHSIGGFDHFAIVAAPSNDEAFLKRHAALGNMGIRPIWYPEGAFTVIEELLARALDAAAPPHHAEPRANMPIIPRTSDTDVDAEYWEGIAALRARQYDVALDFLRRVASHQPDYKSVRTKISEAEGALKRAELEADAHSAEAASDWTRAASVLERLVSLCPGETSVVERLAQVTRRAKLEDLLEETREMHKRKNWAAVVESFAEMRRLDPSLPDTDGWLDQARGELKELETRRLVKVHLREGIQQFEAQEWAKALSALHRVLELDPAHETARTLHAQAQSRVTQAEAAALLLDRYRSATRAIAAKDWNEAVELLNAVVTEKADYEDAALLLESAADELADAVAELDVRLSAKPSPTPPNSTATWKLMVKNAGRVVISEIVVRENSAPANATSPSSPPFALAPGESKTFAFKSTHAGRGVRRHIEVEGKTPKGRTVVAEARASVNIVKHEPSASPPATPTPPVAPASPPAGATRPAVGAGTFRPDPSQPVTGNHPAAAFRRSLRLAKDAAPFDDARSNQLLHLLEEGERHYRVSVKDLDPPRLWASQVDTWQQQVAALKMEKIEWVALGLPAADTILSRMEKLAGEIQRRIGILVPVRDLQALAARNH